MLLALAAAPLWAPSLGLASPAPALGGDPDVTGPELIAPLVITPSPNPFCPLTPILTIQVDEPATVEMLIFDGDKSFKNEVGLIPNTTHYLPILGVAAGRLANISLRLTDLAGNRTTLPNATSWAAPELPDEFPPLTVTINDASKMEPGITLLPINRWDQAAGVQDGWVVAVDERGEVIWWAYSPLRLGQVERARSGRLRVGMEQRWALEINAFGIPEVAWWPSALDPASTPPWAYPVSTEAIHHDIIELPPAANGGRMLVLGLERRTFDFYPADEVDTSILAEDVEVAGDEILEIDFDGTVLRRWSLFDIIDPLRICYDSLLGFWNPLYGTVTADWSHGNGLAYDAERDLILVSLRHQDSVIAFSRETGELVWILGDPGRWEAPYSDYLLEPVQLGLSDFEWTYHQHAPKILPGGRLMLFDNGNQRAIPPLDPLAPEQRYSRAVEYAINPETRRVAQLWDYGGPNEQWYSMALGDADPLPLTGNVLVTDGFITDPLGVEPGSSARVFEVTRDDPAEIVFEARVEDSDPESALLWTIYRGERLPGLLP
jgi:arylsulfate sulfotransferase